jgi:hypothetical protein
MPKVSSTRVENPEVPFGRQGQAMSQHVDPAAGDYSLLNKGEYNMKLIILSITGSFPVVHRRCARSVFPI